VRIPEYALGCKLRAYKNGRPSDIQKKGRYAYFECPTEPSAEYSLVFPLRKAVTAEKQYQIATEDDSGRLSSLVKPRIVRTFKVEWRGNTVVNIEPKSPSPAAIFGRRHLDTDEVEWTEVSHFIAENILTW
jgi:hypothetical protein